MTLENQKMITKVQVNRKLTELKSARNHVFNNVTLAHLSFRMKLAP
jgi:hypothetical protein